MPDTVSREPWHITGGSFDIWFDSPGDILWQRNYRGRNTQPLCGPNTVTIRGLGKRNIKLQVQINPGALRNTRKETFVQMAEANLRYTLTPPGGEDIPVKFDPAVAFEEKWQNGMRVLTVGFQEVSQGADSGAPPPGISPLVIWPNPNNIIFAPGDTEKFVTVSWAGLVYYNIDNAIWITDLAHTSFYGTGLVIPKTVSGSIVYTIGTSTPPAGTYQWVLKAAIGGTPPYDPVYSGSFTLTRP